VLQTRAKAAVRSNNETPRSTARSNYRTYSFANSISPLTIPRLVLLVLDNFVARPGHSARRARRSLWFPRTPHRFRIINAGRVTSASSVHCAPQRLRRQYVGHRISFVRLPRTRLSCSSREHVARDEGDEGSRARSDPATYDSVGLRERICET